jgi:glyoxylase-like metal-dependent hydrolase (beta-lactamase superfamily II)
MKNRPFVFYLIVTLLAVFSWPERGAAEEVEIVPVEIAEQLYMLTGKGGNMGLFIGDDGTFLIDDQFAPLSEKIREAIRSVGGSDPRFLLNTHYHGDHTGGNEVFGSLGSLILSHDNVRERLAEGTYLEVFKAKREGLAKEGLPVVTYSQEMTLHINGETVEVIHIPGAHTDGDSFIFFHASNVIHAGDIFFNGIYPFIDLDHGGSLRGMIEGAKLIHGLSDENTRIIPGHGPLADKADLAGYIQMLETALARLEKLKNAGKSVDQAVEADPLSDYEEGWGDGLFDGDRWIEIIYPGV